MTEEGPTGLAGLAGRASARDGGQGRGGPAPAFRPRRLALARRAAREPAERPTRRRGGGEGVAWPQSRGPCSPRAVPASLTCVRHKATRSESSLTPSRRSLRVVAHSESSPRRSTGWPSSSRRTSSPCSAHRSRTSAGAAPPQRPAARAPLLVPRAPHAAPWISPARACQKRKTCTTLGRHGLPRAAIAEHWM